MSEGLFITGTDTDVGKTVVSALLTYSFAQKVSTTYFKPIQSGSPTDTATLKSWLPETSSLKISSSVYEFQMPASPDRAAQAEGRNIDFQYVQKVYRELSLSSLPIVEGAGGLEVPLNSSQTVSDLISTLNLPCVLVASTRLGTINHTLLTVHRLRQKNIHCLGLVLNGSEDPGLVELLEQQSGLPVLFHLNWQDKIDYHFFVREWQENQALQSFVEKAVANQKCERASPLGSSDFLSELSQTDKNYVWHPFTQHGLVKNHPIVTRAKDSILWMGEKKVIDAVSSWWVNILGHCHPEISQALKQQVDQLEHVVFAGLTHQPAIELSEKLIQITRKKGCKLDKVFFSDNGSTAVEVALKMAHQYQRQSGGDKRPRFLALKGSYHGDTLGAMSVGARGGFHEVFEPLMFDVDFVDPFSETELEQAFASFGHELAAVIVEPMVQGAGGMRMYPASFLNRLNGLAQEYSVLTIADEIFTGFYRTGRFFAFEHSELRPDFLCLSKGLTGGYLPLSVTLAGQDFYNSFLGDSLANAFLHGHSYTANPLACRVACQTLEILSRPQFEQDLRRVVLTTTECLQSLKDKSYFYNHRQLGTIGALEVLQGEGDYFHPQLSYRLHQRALELGVLLRPLGNTLYSVPPYCTTDEELRKIYSVMNQIVEEEI